jgi:hypothetical protein
MRLFIVTAKLRGVPYGAQHWADTFCLAVKIPGDLVELTGIEPVTSCLQSRRSPN